MNKINISKHNSAAWDEESIEGSEWCTPVDGEIIARAKRGEVLLKLTPNKYVPDAWLDGVRGKDVLCLASGGGQQAPVLAAAGASVTSLDVSKEQLARDEFVAQRDGLTLRTIKGDMSDLSVFADENFDLVVHAVSNIYVPDVNIVWKECYRVLRPGGELFAGFMNPSFFLFNHKKSEECGILTVEYKLPYSDFESLDEERRRQIIDDQVPIVFSHSLDDQIGGQIEAGFVITGFYEDWWSDEATPLNEYSPTTIVTRAVKP
ncbi:MAG: methyltransferase domain-containing protein [Deltaproteobacteria bacterium]